MEASELSCVLEGYGRPRGSANQPPLASQPRYEARSLRSGVPVRWQRPDGDRVADHSVSPADEGQSIGRGAHRRRLGGGRRSRQAGVGREPAWKLLWGPQWNAGPLLVTTNRTVAEVEGAYGEAVASRSRALRTRRVIHTANVMTAAQKAQLATRMIQS
jgi:hypothetical protein